MGTLQSTRINDQWPDGTPISHHPDLTPALGTWFNCNLGTGEILFLSLTEADQRLILRAHGAGVPSPLSWRNTHRNSKGIHRVVLAREGDRCMLHARGIGCDDDWGQVPVVPHATHVASREPAGFLARYDFGFSELSLGANEAKGLLIIASCSTFRDGGARSSYFTREFFYREGDDPSA